MAHDAANRLRVFVSHSASAVEEPATQAFLDKLLGRIGRQATLQALVDQRHLQAGDDWLQRLYGWMGLCDAAVILLSPRAVKRENSAWVPREANLLMWRKAMDPNFFIVPVLLGGLKAGDLAGNPFVADLRLSDLQFADAATETQKIDRIVKALAARAGSQPPVFDPIQVHVEDGLQRFAAGAAVKATLQTRCADHGWRPYEEAHRNLSLHLVRQSVAEAVDGTIAEAARGSQAEFKLAMRLFQALYPLRLPAETACSLLALCRRQVGRGAVVVNCHDTWALRMLLRAATGLLEDSMLRTWRIVELPDGWGDNDEAEASELLARELAEAVLGTGGWELLQTDPDPLASLAGHLRDYQRDTGAPILACAAFSTRWLTLSPLLAARFSTVVFVLWAGPAMPPELASSTANFEALAPALPTGQDRRWLAGYRRKLQLLGSPA